MPSFNDNLAILPAIDKIARLILTNPIGETITLENKPGTSGSVAVYAAVSKEFGYIDTKSASSALALYAEHTEDAKTHPGKHPNIDRLFDIVEYNLKIEVEVIAN